MNSLTYKEISKLLDLVESEIFKLEDRKRKETSMQSIGSLMKDKEDEAIPDWNIADRKLETDMTLLNGIKDKFTQLFDRINFTFGVDNNRFNQPKQENLPNGQ